MKHKSILTALWLALACALPVGAQVHGVIVDVSGEPLIGVNVMLEGTSMGTITDFDGKFELDVEVPAVLQISYMGYDGSLLQPMIILPFVSRCTRVRSNWRRLS